MQSLHLNIAQKATYYTLGNGRKLIYVLHGYGQLARFFIKKFKPLEELGFTIAAPEGSHRFYLKGTSGRVGASWMTKENRTLDIENHVNYLKELHKTISHSQQYESIDVLGYSQGVSTAFRWLANENWLPNNLLICSGMIPPEIDLNKAPFNSINTAYFSGNEDPYREESYVQEMQQRLRELETAEIVEFNGKHEVHIPSILEFFKTQI